MRRESLERQGSCSPLIPVRNLIDQYNSLLGKGNEIITSSPSSIYHHHHPTEHSDENEENDDRKPVEKLVLEPENKEQSPLQNQTENITEPVICGDVDDENDNGIGIGDDEYSDDDNVDTVWPYYNMHETDTRVVIYIELPGVNDEDIMIKYYDNKLRIKGSRCTLVEGAKCHFKGRHEGVFEKTIDIPVPIQKHTVKISFRHGVMKVYVKKIDLDKKRTKIIFTLNASKHPRKKRTTNAGWTFAGWLLENGLTTEYKEKLEEFGFYDKASIKAINKTSLDLMGLTEKKHLGFRTALLAAVDNLNDTRVLKIGEDRIVMKRHIVNKREKKKINSF